MSMDLEVWSKAAFRLPKQLPEAGNWQLLGDEWAYDGGEWQILVVVGDDAPQDSVTAKLPEAAQAAYVSLEPIGAPPEAYKMLEGVVRELAKSSAGVWVDPSGTPYLHDEGTF